MQPPTHDLPRCVKCAENYVVNEYLNTQALHIAIIGKTILEILEAIIITNTFNQLSLQHRNPEKNYQLPIMYNQYLPNKKNITPIPNIYEVIDTQKRSQPQNNKTCGTTPNYSGKLLIVFSNTDNLKTSLTKFIKCLKYSLK